MTASIVIVGAGPAGTTAALLLARRGIRSILVERRSSPLFHPAAHVINARTLEIWNEYSPELAKSIAAMSPPHETVNLISWYGGLSDETIGSIDLLSDPERKAAVESQSPFMVSHIGQHILMPALWDAVEAEPLIEFRRGVSVQSVESFATDARVTLAGEPSELRAQYVLACDGANSAIRESAGIALSGPVLANMGSAFFTSKTLFPDDARPLLSWIYTPDLCGVLIAHADHRYILMTAYLHPDQEIAVNSRGFWREMLPKVLGDHEFDLESTGTWMMTSQTADRFRRDRLLLLGDAAHRFPHTGGFGLNSGVQDAHNVVWKLDAVLSGAASPSLLDTYDTERRPVVEKFAEQSVTNHFRMDAIGKKVGITNAMLARATAAMGRPPLAKIPGRIIAPLAAAATRGQMRRSRRLNPDVPGAGQLRQQIADAIPLQVEHFVSTGLQFGYLYSSPLIAGDSTAKPTEDVVDYVPTTYPGARLPHAVFSVDGTLVSAHDALDPNLLSLFTFDRDSWSPVVEELADLGPGVSLVAVDAPTGVDRDALIALYEVGDVGAVLVRPDGHVAWRTATSAEQARQSLADFLGRQWGAYFMGRV
ncbi:FAD-dependent monooxygenase [Rhodococcoides yunnanense]|jgi:2,4-dichlorophenol 6-monooxygenase|uniref:FAD-dependent monooxygenase n=1 Tax=Rhodococcoides yunnanense TaxID=278209 RepID=UPI0022B16762|nr:FAD-dependent monooxygenase [Rhodococcus yunnanensis]MCZ4274671.1 FAD-dependent monooxygenase [Rhodococcus yunnanensis]